jgi:predicted Zn-dependent protease
VPEAAVWIEPLTEADVASAVELAVRVLRVRPGDRGEQFAADITGQHRQMFVAKANGDLSLLTIMDLRRTQGAGLRVLCSW